MGGSLSKESSAGPQVPTDPNVQFLTQNYGLGTVNQFKTWIKLGFPDSGSFSVRQLEQLKKQLEEEKAGEIEKNKQKGRKKRRFVLMLLTGKHFIN